MGRGIRLLIIGTIFVASLATPGQVRADVAPPESAPGSSLTPGGQATQVRMMAETVRLDVSPIDNKQPRDSSEAVQAKVSASFTMRNLGTTEEKMAARFPLMNPGGQGAGWGNFPEIKDIVVRVDKKKVPTGKSTTPNEYDKTIPIPWATFDVVFPPGEDVLIDVTYTLHATGYLPNSAFTYILETGAGWKDTIGSVDLTVHFPYAVTRENVLKYEEDENYLPGGQMVGNELRWHLTDLEPTQKDNMMVIIVNPQSWQQVLAAQEIVDKAPQNGDAWGELARACKLVLFAKRGLRQDEGGKSLYQKSVDAYEKAIALVPGVARWHSGYAELLWNHYFWDTDHSDYALLTRIVREMKTANMLDKDLPQVKELLLEISSSMPEAISSSSSGYTYTILTATPVATETLIGPPPGWEKTLTVTAQVMTEQAAIQPVITQTSLPTFEVKPTAAATQTKVPPTQTAVPTVEKKPASRFPAVCGGAALPLMLVGLWRVISPKKGVIR